MCACVCVCGGGGGRGGGGGLIKGNIAVQNRLNIERVVCYMSRSVCLQAKNRTGAL